MYFKDNISIQETKRSLKPDTSIAMGVILLILIYFVSSTGLGIVVGMATSLLTFSGMDPQDYGDFNLQSYLSEMMDPIIVASLITLIVPIFLVYLFSTRYHGRNIRSLGLLGKNSPRDYLIGLIIGIGSVSLIVATLALTGNVEITNNIGNIPILLFILYIVGWIIQGFAEEFLTRSAIMNLLASKTSIVNSILINALIFSLLHFFNSGFSILPSINLFLTGILFSLMFYLADNIWLAAAFHSFWNMAQSNIFGAQVSGNPATDATIFKITFPENNILNGGSFGIEGGIICTIVIIVGILVFFKLSKDKGLIVSKEEVVEEEY